MMDNSVNDKLPLWQKALILLLVAVFTLVGIIGLVLPVIPGILFLGVAALLMARISRRFASRLRGSRHWGQWQRWRRSGARLSAPDRVRLAFLLGCRRIISGLQRVVERSNPR